MTMGHPEHFYFSNYKLSGNSSKKNNVNKISNVKKNHVKKQFNVNTFLLKQINDNFVLSKDFQRHFFNVRHIIKKKQ